jgi:hypothetical protein
LRLERRRGLCAAALFDHSKQAEQDCRNEREYTEDPNDVKVHVQGEHGTDLWQGRSSHPIQAGAPSVSQSSGAWNHSARDSTYITLISAISELIRYRGKAMATLA